MLYRWGGRVPTFFRGRALEVHGNRTYVNKCGVGSGTRLVNGGVDGVGGSGWVVAEVGWGQEPGLAMVGWR